MPCFLEDQTLSNMTITISWTSYEVVQQLRRWLENLYHFQLLVYIDMSLWSLYKYVFQSLPSEWGEPL